jgi:hypothetical protein
MSSRSDVLPAALDVLDRADAEVARTRLLAVVQAAGTAHAPEVLTRAVDAHLTSSPGVPAALGNAVPFDFGWDRPASPTEQQVRWERRRLQRWLTLHMNHVTPAAQTLFALATVVGMGLGAGLAFINPPQHATHIWISRGIISLMAGGLGFCGFGLFRSILGPQLRRVKDEGEVAADLPRPALDYLTYPGPRAYVRGLLASGWPEFLTGDVRRLEALFAHEREAALAKQQQARQALQEAEREKERTHRIATLTQALSHLDAS